MLADLDSAQSLSPNSLLKGPVVSLVYVILISNLDTYHPFKGTYPFMAMEVSVRSYFLHPSQDAELANCPLKYNPLHDLESLWWVAVWTLFVHGLQEDTDTKYDPYKHQQEFYELFDRYGGSRVMVLLDTACLRSTFASLPAQFQASTRPLTQALALIVERYRQAERGLTIDEQAFENVHDELAALLCWAKSLLPTGNMPILDDIVGHPCGQTYLSGSE